MIWVLWTQGLAPGYRPTIIDVEALTRSADRITQWRDIMIEGMVAQIRKPMILRLG